MAADLRERVARALALCPSNLPGIQADALIRELEADRDKWADQATRNLVAWNDALLQAKQAEAERDSARADAERYRWLREYNTAKHPEVTKAFFLGDANLDAAIDAARSKE